MKRIVVADHAYVQSYRLKNEHDPYRHAGLCTIDLAMVTALAGAGFERRLRGEVQFSNLPIEVFNEIEARIDDKRLVRYRVVLEEISEHDERMERAYEFVKQTLGPTMPADMVSFAEAEIERESK